MNEFLYSNPILAALFATTISGAFATGFGAIPVLVIKKLSEKLNNNLLSFAAGVMLAATFFSLILPSMNEAIHLGATKIGAVLQTILGITLGGTTLALIHKYTPHKHFSKGAEGKNVDRLKKIWLFVWAITLHNFPEGLSVGVAAASGDQAIGIGTTIGIGLQNIPEGLSVAVALRSEGYSGKYSFGVACLTGFVEIIGGLIGAIILTISIKLLPLALAYAAGAMLFVVSDEIIPETHREGFESGATAALFFGFCLMMFLDTVFSQ